MRLRETERDPRPTVVKLYKFLRHFFQLRVRGRNRCGMDPAAFGHDIQTERLAPGTLFPYGS